MPTYQLSIQIDSEGLNILNEAGQFVTMVKSVSPGTLVVWVSFRPLGANIVTWSETYSVYASTSPILYGAQIMAQSTQPAVGGYTYTLSGGQFDNGEPRLLPTMVGVMNDDPDFRVDGVQLITSGIYQEAIVNGALTVSPLNAVGIPYRELTTFMPTEKVQVFASDFGNNGLVISSVTWPTLLVDLTQGPQTIHYNAATNQFVMGPLP